MYTYRSGCTSEIYQQQNVYLWKKKDLYWGRSYGGDMRYRRQPL